MLIVGLLAALTGGCASREADAEFHPVWPQPPAPAKVIHLKNLRGGSDFGQAGLLEQIGRTLGGDTAQRRLNQPNSIAVDEAGRVFVSDQEWQGIHVFEFGSAKARFIDRVADDYFVSPVGLAVVDEAIAVADSALNRVDLIDMRGNNLRRFIKPGGFMRPAGLAFDPDHEELYVVDTLAHEICIFDLEGRLVRRFGEPGSDIGQFNFPTHVFIDEQARLFVTDSLNFRVQVFDRSGEYLFEIGRHGDASGHFGVPKGVAVDQFGHIYVVDSYFSNVQVFDTDGRFLLSIGGPGRRSGQFQVPSGLTIDSNNHIYICDSHNQRVQMLQFVGDAENETQ
jgi:DNA-binding beta-propeller fold protein YncE